MPAPRSLGRALLVLAPAGMLAAALYALFALRFEHGDVWPPYSSFRADPLGTRILFTALGETPGLRTERLLDTISRAKLQPPATLLAAGLESDVLTSGRREGFQALLDFVDRGGRAVLACTPDEPVDPASPHPRWFLPDEEKDEKGAAPGAKKKDAKKSRDPAPGGTNAAPKRAAGKGAGGRDVKAGDAKAGGGDGAAADRAGKDGKPPPDAGATNRPARFVSARGSFLKALGIEVAVVTQRQEKAAAPAVASPTPTPRPPPEPPPAGPAGPSAAGGFGPVAWHSALYFRPGTGTPWRTVYACGDRAVMVERPWGRGTLVLASDSYFLSNEAMLKHRHPALLAWLVGRPGRVVFDEYHLGVRSQPGVTALARRYGLGGVLAALALLAGLFVWRNAASFLPPAEVESDRGEVAGGLESRNALLNLMRRNLRPADLPRICFEEWNRCRPRNDPRGERRAARMKQALDEELRRPEAERDPLAACRRLQAIGKEKAEP